MLLFWNERPEGIPHGGSFVISDLSKLLTVALLLREMKVIRSRSLFFKERQSESLTVAQWYERFWAKEQIPNPEKMELPGFWRLRHIVTSTLLATVTVQLLAKPNNLEYLQ